MVIGEGFNPFRPEPGTSSRRGGGNQYTTKLIKSHEFSSPAVTEIMVGCCPRGWQRLSN
ncbi:MAG: hypothetical protein K2H46_02685 [Muribaculaceae bacterium]|nr:hypothetical protein [Muribaculaceae bacterium]